MPFSYLILKIFHKLKIGILIYPILQLLNKLFCYVKLPTLKMSWKILVANKNNRYINKSQQYYQNLYIDNNYKKGYDLQIIIPVYNSEKYIQSCLNSILHQKTKYTFQIIIVNDGSTDNTLDILNRYKSNSDVKLINQNNMGRSGARNTGLNYATNSNYIMFVDSDDKLSKNAIQHLLSVAYKCKSDMVYGGYCVINDKSYFVKKRVDCKNNNHIQLNSSDDMANGLLCGKLFLSKLFQDVRFPVGYEFEDTILAFWIYPHCKHITSINNIVYFYRDNPKSISNNINHNNVSIDSFLITNYILKLLPEYNVTIDQYLYNTFLAQVKINCTRNIYENVIIQKSIFVLTCKLFHKYFKCFTTNINKYKPLERAIRQQDYYGYILYCLLF